MTVTVTVNRGPNGKIISVEYCADGQGLPIQRIATLSIEDLDWSIVTPFQQSVYRELIKVPSGAVISYGELAERVGRPGAARAIGTAMAKNPFLFIVPCHRVVRGNGHLGGFACGLDVKKWLLEYESKGVV
jgi:O-6-methylguanine DNA methyltransferase